MIPDLKSFTDYNLVIPTHNRAPHLRRLLSYLERIQFPCPIVIFDSSKPENKALNRDTINQSKLQIKLLEFDPQLPFYQKLRNGLAALEKSLFSFCADDDFLIPQGLAQLLQAMAEKPEFVFAQGYFLRYQRLNTGLTLSIEYTAKSYLDPHPLDRLRQVLQGYEATFYSVFQREVFIDLLDTAAPVKSMLLNELMTAVLPVLRGPAIGLPVACYVRGDEAQAQNYKAWHPVIWFLDDHNDMFQDYILYRDTLVKRFAKDLEAQDISREHLARVLDLTHGYYFAETFQGTAPMVLSQLGEAIHGPHGLSRESFRTFQPARRSWWHDLSNWINQLMIRRRDKYYFPPEVARKLGKEQLAFSRQAVRTYFEE